MHSRLLAVMIGGESQCGSIARAFLDRDVRTVFIVSINEGFYVLKKQVPDFVVICVDRKIRGGEIEFALLDLAMDTASYVYVVGDYQFDPSRPEYRTTGALRCIPTSSVDELGVVVEKDIHEYERKTFGDFKRDVSIEKILPGHSSQIRSVIEQIEKAGPTMAPVLLTGESGTGKEHAAEAIHAISPQRGKPLVAANCGAIPHQLIQSELFGHVKGSFTGAVRDHVGYFEQANDGTLFLDEITEMPIDLQVNLLRVVETGMFRRVGGDRDKKVNFRLISSTNRDPYEAVEKGYLRKDLFYRIQVFHIRMPPLRTRDRDVEMIANLMLDEHNRKGRTYKKFSDEAMKTLLNYPWPGNIRELKNIVYRSYIVSGNTIEVFDLPRNVVNGTDPFSVHNVNGVGTTISEMEEKLIVETLEQCSGRREEAARILGVSSKTLYNRLRDYRNRGSREVDRGN